MNSVDAEDLPRPAGGTTADYKGGAPGASGLPTFAPPPGREQADEEHALLRKRLRIISVIFTVAPALFALRTLPVFFQSREMPGASGVDPTLRFVYLGISAFLTVLLWRMPSPSLRQLRTLELMLWGINTAYFAWQSYGVFARGYVHRYAEEAGAGMTTLARFSTLPWLVLIIVYGTCIPNQGRRCIAVVGVVALTPLTISLVAGARAGVATPLLVVFLMEMSIWLVIAAAIAVYGSYRIEALRREVSEARQLGPYQLRCLLGTGGMAKVYLAEHQLLRRPCALKLIRPERAGNVTDLNRFEREAQTTASLAHPNIVELFDYGRAQDGTIY